MKTSVSMVLSVLLVGTSLLALEPSDYEMDIPSVDQKVSHHKHTDTFGDTYFSNTSKNAKNCVLKAAHDEHQKLSQTPKEIMVGLKASLDAITQMHYNRIPDAQKSLSLATASFNTALKANPNLKMVPIATEVDVDELDMTTQQIMTLTRRANEELSKHAVQNARELLIPLKDEMRFTVQYLPMQLYPKATQAALNELSKGENAKALETMTSALETIVSESSMTPIPLLEAQTNIEMAMKLDKTKKSDASVLIQDAKNDIAKTVALGYLNDGSNEYKQLQNEIDSVENAINGETKVAKMIDSLKMTFEHAIAKARTQSHKLLSEIHSI